MKLNTTDFGRKLQHPLLLALGSVPLALIIVLNFAPDRWTRAWCFPAAFVLLAWGCILIPGRKRLAAGVVSAALVALQIFILPPRGQIGLLLLAAMNILLLFVSLPIGGWPRHQELNVGWHVGGVLTHVLLQFLINGSKLMGDGIHDPAQTPLLVNFLCYAVLVLLAMNRSSLEAAAQSRRQVPVLMRRQNVIITVALLAVGVGVAAIPAVGRLLSAAWEGLMRLIVWLVEMLMRLYPQADSAAGGDGGMGDMGLGFGEAAPPSALAVLLEKVIGVAAVIVIIIAVILLIRVGWKKLRRLLRYLWQRLSQYGMAASEDYEDEITSTRDEEGVQRESVFSRLRRMAPQDEKDLTPAQRVRSRYRRLKQRRRWSEAATARETLPAEAANLYERARYSGQEITETEAESFREGTKKL